MTKKQKIKLGSNLNRVLSIISNQGLYSPTYGRIYSARLNDSGTVELMGWHDVWFVPLTTDYFHNQRGEQITVMEGGAK